MKDITNLTKEVIEFGFKYTDIEMIISIISLCIFSDYDIFEILFNAQEKFYKRYTELKKIANQ